LSNLVLSQNEVVSEDITTAAGGTGISEEETKIKPVAFARIVNGVVFITHDDIADT
jgi:hypothetical protein